MKGRSSIHERKEKLNLRYTILRILHKSPKNFRLLSSQIAINFITLDQSPTPSFQIREKSLNSFDINNPTSPSTLPPHLFPSRGKSKRKRRNSHEKRLHVSMTTTDVYTCTSGEQRKIERERERG